jgi:uncharacterized protein YjiS (DUF1127 family)
MTSKVLTASSRLGRLFVVVEVITRRARQLRKLPSAIAHRGQLRKLADSDDYLLADVGVTRADIETALSAPFWRDPSAELVHWLSKRSPDKAQRNPGSERVAMQPRISLRSIRATAVT